jgi:hypothetical protein
VLGDVDWRMAAETLGFPCAPVLPSVFSVTR